MLPDASDSSSDEEEEDSRTWINEDEALAAMGAPRLLRDDRYGAWRVAIAESEDDPFAHQERMLSMSGADAARCMDALWTVVELCGPWAVRVRIAQARDALPVLAQATTHPRLPGPHWLGARVAGRAVRGLPPTASMTGLLPARQVCHLLLAYIRQSAAQHPANASAPLNAVGVDVASGSADFAVCAGAGGPAIQRTLLEAMRDAHDCATAAVASCAATSLRPPPLGDESVTSEPSADWRRPSGSIPPDVLWAADAIVPCLQALCRNRVAARHDQGASDRAAAAALLKLGRSVDPSALWWANDLEQALAGISGHGQHAGASDMVLAGIAKSLGLTKALTASGEGLPGLRPRLPRLQRLAKAFCTWEGVFAASGDRVVSGAVAEAGAASACIVELRTWDPALWAVLSNDDLFWELAVIVSDEEADRARRRVLMERLSARDEAARARAWKPIEKLGTPWAETRDLPRAAADAISAAGDARSASAAEAGPAHPRSAPLPPPASLNTPSSAPSEAPRATWASRLGWTTAATAARSDEAESEPLPLPPCQERFRFAPNRSRPRRGLRHWPSAMFAARHILANAALVALHPGAALAADTWAEGCSAEETSGLCSKLVTSFVAPSTCHVTPSSLAAFLAGAMRRAGILGLDGTPSDCIGSFLRSAKARLRQADEELCRLLELPGPAPSTGAAKGHAAAERVPAGASVPLPDHAASFFCLLDVMTERLAV